MKLHHVSPMQNPQHHVPDGYIIETPLDPRTLSHEATGHGTRGEIDYTQVRDLKAAKDADA